MLLEPVASLPRYILLTLDLLNIFKSWFFTFSFESMVNKVEAIF